MFKLIKEIMGNRKISVSREISKKHEEIYRGLIDNVLEELTEPRGEFVLVVEGNKDIENYDDIDILDHINLLIKKGIRDKDAIKEVSKLHNISKSEVYKMYLEVKKWN